MQVAVSKFVELNRVALAAQVPWDADKAKREAVLRDSLHAAHRLLSGQEVNVVFQVWQLTPGQNSQRQLCPLVTYGGAQSKASFSGQLTPFSSMDMEPVFQFVAGRVYYLTFYIVNRDPTSLQKLPFTDAIEVCARGSPSSHCTCPVSWGSWLTDASAFPPEHLRPCMDMRCHWEAGMLAWRCCGVGGCRGMQSTVLHSCCRRSWCLSDTMEKRL